MSSENCLQYTELKEKAACSWITLCLDQEIKTYESCKNGITFIKLLSKL